MSLAHPARRVSIQKSAQTGFSECGLNLIGQVAAETPAPVLVLLPSHDEAKNYNRSKLQPMIDASPAVRGKIRDLVSRDESGSTLLFKRFPGGYLAIVGANSSKNLQMRSARVLINDEISEFPTDVDGRGDPIALAEQRLTMFTGREKIVDISTPALKGSCRVSDLYERSSRGRFMVACPHCDTRQALEFENLRFDEADPSNACYHCQACGAAIDQRHKADMLAAGIWVHERPELIEIHAGYAINALYSPVLSWTEVAAKYLDAREKGTMKVFTQQVLGLPYEEKGEAPDHALLYRKREPYPLRRLPPEALFLTGAADVQGDRLEWSVYAWGAGLTAWLVDTGIILGQPTAPATWRQLDEIIARHYEDARGRQWPIDAFGVDSGFSSHDVYRWVHRHPRREAVFALDGRGDPLAPPLGTPKKVDIDFGGRKIGATLLWPVGTHGLKLEHYAAVRRTIEADGPDAIPRGGLHLPDQVTDDYCRQLVSEFLASIATRAGVAKREWRKITGTRNEALDVAVYARALAHHLSDSLTPAEWAALAARRAAEPERAQLDLAALWSDRFGDATPPATTPPAPEEPRPAAPPPAFIPRRQGWLPRGGSWLNR